MSYLITFFFNVLYLVFRATEIKLVEKDRPVKAAISQMIQSSLWLISTFFGLRELINNSNPYIAIVYITSAGVGTFLGTHVNIFFQNLENKKILDNDKMGFL